MNRLARRALPLFLALVMLCMTGCGARAFLPLNILRAPEGWGEEDVYVPSEDYYGRGVYEPEDFLFSGRVFIVGDSTVCSRYGESRVEKQDLMGWGKYIGYFMTPEITSEEGAQGVTVYNFAESGGSALSYLQMEGYQLLTEHLGKGDYLLIQFGHNDQDKTAADYTSPTLSREETDAEGRDEEGVYSFEWLLYEKYIKLARDVGAVPILVSPTCVRSPFTGEGRTEGHAPYRAVMRSLCEECGIPFIDLTARSAELYAEMVAEGGAEATEVLHAFTDFTRANLDPTHLSQYGAFRFAGLVVEELEEKELALANFIIEPKKTLSPRNS